jgi:ATP-dependent helicase HepA
VVIKLPDIRPGTLLLECNFLLDSATASSPRIRRYLPPALIRIVLDDKGANQTAKLAYERIGKAIGAIDKDTAKKVVALKQAVIRELSDRCHKQATDQAATTIDQLRESTAAMLLNEIRRLRELAEINPNVREEEIRFFESELDEVNRMFNSVIPRLDALRVLIAT